MALTNLKIEGMHCRACFNHVKRALERIDGIRINEVLIGSASIEAHDVEAAIAAVTKAGYSATRA